MAVYDVIYRLYVVVSAAQWLKVLWPAMALVGLLCGGVLAYQYFMIYPQESKGMFDYWIKEKADQLKNAGRLEGVFSEFFTGGIIIAVILWSND